ncbi:unnamed protein product [Acanthoscelides obtectus]|uniref:VPS9 domain-containing protein n=1 Tax=Acanthoscelides obtectus TaxID=200917 RepID=A0A9P0PWD2_ACAOB|nr:unnamed protein product [Acanthoscelides obtectus]CAK1663922.1 Ankyrin repeat domain-containing protein 27 [Acanthoscelides obtectus]
MFLTSIRPLSTLVTLCFGTLRDNRLRATRNVPSLAYFVRYVTLTNGNIGDRDVQVERKQLFDFVINVVSFINMWSQYDENLNENSFFKEITENHCDLIERAAIESWIICVPRAGSISFNDVSLEVILDHILIPSTEDNFCTLNKRNVTVQNKQLNCDASAIFSSRIEILFEETFYVKKTLKYTVWCIDRPLFMKFKNCNSYTINVLQSLHDCIDFLWAESLGHGILHSIRELCSTFVNKNVDIEAECLQTQKELLGNLFSKCLQVGFQNKVLRDKCNNSSFLENFKLAVETYMQHCLGRKLNMCVNTLQHQTDSVLNKIIRNSCDIQYQDLGISNHFSDVITNAKCELNKINNHVTVLDKMTCIKRTFEIIFQSKDVNTDDVLEIFVFLILKQRVNNWSANLIYLKEFRFSSSENIEKNSYFLATFEAALEFIKSNKFFEINEKNSSTNHIAISCLYEKIKSDRIISLEDVIDKTKSLFEEKLCHPLCICENCLNIVKNRETEMKMFSPNYCNEKGQNLLITATIMDNCEVVDFLITHNFNVNSTDLFNRTSLHYAASHGYQDILMLLINHNADVNAADSDKNTPLHLACQNGQENCVKALLYSSGIAELNLGNFFGDTPLHLATKWGYFDIIKTLLENEASVVVKNKRNQLALNLAPNYYILKLFGRFGAKRSTTVIREIIENCTLSITELSTVNDDCKQKGVEHGVRPKDLEHFRKVDLLLKAIESNDLPLTCFYLGFTCNSQTMLSSKCCHPLCNCDKCENEQDMEVKPPHKNEQPVNINMCNVNGVTPLHLAAKCGRTQILRLLLDSGALPNVQAYKTLHSPLHLACIFQRVQIVRELLKCGNCKIDIQDAKGNTPLFYACMKNDVKIVDILLSNGADCSVKNLAGKSPVQESEVNMQYSVFKLMKDSIASYLQKDTNDTF